MAEHSKTLSAIFPLLLRGEGGDLQILLHRRQNTGYMDGCWDIAGSGHVDEGETARAAVIRECREELGIGVDAENIAFVHLSHRFSPDRVYYDLYFRIGSFTGVPAIMEPDKCCELRWFPLAALPQDLIPCRRQDIAHILQDVRHSEKIER